MAPRQIRSHTLGEAMASLREKAEAFASLSPEEQAAQHARNREILSLYHGGGLVGLTVTGRTPTQPVTQELPPARPRTRTQK